MARMLIISGLLLLAAGVLLWFFPGIFRYFGRLPGDFRFKSGHTEIYFPLSTGLLISLIISLLLRIFNSGFFKQ